MTKQDIKKLDATLAQLSIVMKRIWGQTYQKALDIEEVRKAIKEGKEFEWMKEPNALSRFEKMLAKLQADEGYIIAAGIKGAVKDGTKAGRSAIGGKTTAEDEKEIEKKVIDSHRDKSSGGFSSFTRTDKTDRISKRVWAITEASKKEMEIIIQNGIKEGKTAEQISQSVRGYLNNPKSLFRRVRNKETGELELSKAAKNYHPGRGVYRSAHANAMRLARTEVKAAYMEAERQSYIDDDMVIGIHIGKSANHTTKMPNGEVKELHDICDRLEGDYPKTFVFTGWHPQCRCIMTPILAKKSQRGQNIEKLPSNFTSWFKENEDRIANAKVMPYFVQNNMAMIQGKSASKGGKD